MNEIERIKHDILSVISYSNGAFHATSNAAFAEIAENLNIMLLDIEHSLPSQA